MSICVRLMHALGKYNAWFGESISAVAQKSHMSCLSQLQACAAIV